MKKEQVLNAIVGKLISEGVLAENYNTNEALMVLSHCVMPIKLQTYLVNCEEEVKMRLEKLSQIKQINATENPESLPRIKQQFTADEAEDYINQEVEKRIAERMPSEDDGRDRIPYPDKPTELKHYQNIGFIRGWRAAIKECRSRLSQKTEG